MRERPCMGKEGGIPPGEISRGGGPRRSCGASVSFPFGLVKVTEAGPALGHSHALGRSACPRRLVVRQVRKVSGCKSRGKKTIHTHTTTAEQLPRLRRAGSTLRYHARARADARQKRMTAVEERRGKMRIYAGRTGESDQGVGDWGRQPGP